MLVLVPRFRNRSAGAWLARRCQMTFYTSLSPSCAFHDIFYGRTQPLSCVAPVIPNSAKVLAEAPPPTEDSARYEVTIFADVTYFGSVAVAPANPDADGRSTAWSSIPSSIATAPISGATTSFASMRAMLCTELSPFC